MTNNMIQSINALKQQRALNNATNNVKIIDVYENVNIDVDIQRNVTRFHNVEYVVACDVSTFAHDINIDKQNVDIDTRNVEIDAKNAKQHDETKHVQHVQHIVQKQYVIMTTCNTQRTLSNVSLYEYANNTYNIVFRSKTSSLMNMYEYIAHNTLFNAQTFDNFDKICRTINNIRATRLKKFIDNETMNNATK